MGYRPPEQQYRILFADEDMQGFELIVHSASTRKVLELAEMKLSLATPDDLKSTYEYFASRIVSWNLEDADGNKLMPTCKTLMSQEPAWVAKVISGWLRAVGTGIKPSAPATAVIHEADLPMEVLA